MRWLLYLFFFYAVYRFFKIVTQRIAFTMFKQTRSGSRPNGSTGQEWPGGQSGKGGQNRSSFRSGFYRSGSGGHGSTGKSRGKPNFDRIEEAEFEDITETTTGTSTTTRSSK